MQHFRALVESQGPVTPVHVPPLSPAALSPSQRAPFSPIPITGDTAGWRRLTFGSECSH